MVPTGFSSWNNFFSFTLAREFVHQGEDERSFGVLSPDTIGRLEGIGRSCSWVLQPIDLLLQNIRNPVVTVSLVLTGLFFVTIAFYGPVVWAFAVAACPPLAKLSVLTLLRVGSFCVLQSTILGLGTKAFGRLNSPKLVKAFQEGRVQAIPFGVVRELFNPA